MKEIQKNGYGFDLDLIWIEIGVFKNFKECARSPSNGNHFSGYKTNVQTLWWAELERQQHSSLLNLQRNQLDA